MEPYYWAGLTDDQQAQVRSIILMAAADHASVYRIETMVVNRIGGWLSTQTIANVASAMHRHGWLEYEHRGPYGMSRHRLTEARRLVWELVARP